jgi:hypothetical protein
MRSPLTLRNLMILPVRTGYICDRIDPIDLPPNAEQLLLSAVVQARR